VSCALEARGDKSFQPSNRSFLRRFFADCSENFLLSLDFSSLDRVPSFTCGHASFAPLCGCRAMRRAAQSLRARNRSSLSRNYAALPSAASPPQQHQEPPARSPRPEQAPGYSRRDEHGQWLRKAAKSRPERATADKGKQAESRAFSEFLDVSASKLPADTLKATEEEFDALFELRNVAVPPQGSSRPKIVYPAEYLTFYDPYVNPRTSQRLPPIQSPTGDRESSTDLRSLSTSQSRLAYDHRFTPPEVRHVESRNHSLALSDPRFDSFVDYRNKSVLFLPLFKFTVLYTDMYFRWRSLVELEQKASDEAFKSRIAGQSGRGWKYTGLNAEWTDSQHFGRPILRLWKTKTGPPGWGNLR
jgi:hypothetical protein